MSLIQQVFTFVLSQCIYGNNIFFLVIFGVFGLIISLVTLFLLFPLSYFLKFDSLAANLLK